MQLKARWATEKSKGMEMHIKRRAIRPSTVDHTYNQAVKRRENVCKRRVAQLIAIPLYCLRSPL